MVSGFSLTYVFMFCVLHAIYHAFSFIHLTFFIDSCRKNFFRPKVSQSTKFPEFSVNSNNFPKFFSLLTLPQGSPSPRANGDHSESRDRDSIGLNGDRNGDKAGSSKLNSINDRPPSRSGSSSSRSTPNLKTKDVSLIRNKMD